MRKIVVDENIPLGREAFAPLGEVALEHGRKISRETLAGAELLIVRSITKVDRDLLEGTPVRFVGTATIGTDHIDQEYLREQGIAFADAAGCNANSVSEYLTAALLDLEAVMGLSLVGKTLGIVGVGNVGGKVAKKGEALGMRVLLNDPPREERGEEGPFVSLNQVLEESDFITLHTPLTREGTHASFHLIGKEEIGRMKPSAVLFNSSRGAVVDGATLLSALETGKMARAVLDVWEKEPTPNLGLLARVHIATPHIAGYSYDGKLTGTRMMLEAACRFLEGEAPSTDLFDVPVADPNIEVLGAGREAVREAVFRAYPILEDDRRMRGLLTAEPDQVGPAFDRLRKEYPVRREFHNYRIEANRLDEEARTTLSALGFHLA
jgi:erythronate-4-phosphate dehydrogenase